MELEQFNAGKCCDPKPVDEHHPGPKLNKRTLASILLHFDLGAVKCRFHIISLVREIYVFCGTIITES